MKFIFSLIRRYSFIVTASIVVSVIAATSALFNIGLFIPFIDAFKAPGAELSQFVQNTPFIENFVLYFKQYTPIVRIRIILGLFFLVTILQFLSMTTSEYLGALIQKKVGRHLGDLAYKRMLSVNLSTLHDFKSGYFYSLLSHHCLVTGSLAGRMVNAVPNIIVSLALILTMINLSWKMTLACLGIVLFTYYVANYCQHIIKKFGQEFKDIVEERNSLLIETVSGLKTIKQFVQEKLFYNKHSEQYNTFTHTRLKIVTLTAIVSNMINLVSMVALISIVMAASFLFPGSPAQWVETLVLFIAILSQFKKPIRVFTEMRVYFFSNIFIVESVRRFLEDDSVIEADRGQAARCQSPREVIQFDGVNFRYGTENKFALQNLSFSIPAGKVTALVGASGAGKSTVTELLLKFYAPEQGRILVDGINLQDVPTAFWRKQIGIVSQDTFLFNDSVSFNITFGDSSVTQEQIAQAAKNSYSYDFIKELPQGFDTILGDRGVKLSVGQRQRIAIARAFILNPKILVLDEATSALDTISEQAIKEAIEKLMVNRTVVVIAHRLSTIRRADNIVVLEEGKIIESGTHDQLVAIENGKYQKYFELSV